MALPPNTVDPVTGARREVSAEDPGHSLRPSRFLQVLLLMEQGMVQGAVPSGPPAVTAAAAADTHSPPTPAQRLLDIDADVRAVLMRIAWPAEAEPCPGV